MSEIFEIRSMELFNLLIGKHANEGSIFFIDGHFALLCFLEICK